MLCSLTWGAHNKWGMSSEGRGSIKVGGAASPQETSGAGLDPSGVTGVSGRILGPWVGVGMAVPGTRWLSQRGMALLQVCKYSLNGYLLSAYCAGWVMETSSRVWTPDPLLLVLSCATHTPRAPSQSFTSLFLIGLHYNSDLLWPCYRGFRKLTELVCEY